MPGFKNVGSPRFVGGGEMPQKKKGFPRRAKPYPLPGKGSVKLPDKRTPLPMPYYPETGSNKRPGGITESQKQTIIKLWEDRNRSNNNTKLNP